jgi:hypothetical protein
MLRVPGRHNCRVRGSRRGKRVSVGAGVALVSCRALGELVRRAEACWLTGTWVPYILVWLSDMNPLARPIK